MKSKYPNRKLPMGTRKTMTDDESALYGIKLYVDRYGDAVMDELKNAGIRVIQSPTCFRVLHTSFRGSLDDLIRQAPALSDYPIRQYNWWRRAVGSIKGD